MVAMAESPVSTGRSCRAVASVYGSYIDEPLVMVKANGERYFYHCNDLYSVYALTDSTGTVVERYIYDPYGRVTVLDGSGTTVRTASLYGNPFTFTGRRLDQETGLMQFRNRMYDTGLGRFVSRDKKGYVDGFSLYGGYFVPSMVDPFGEELPFDQNFGTWHHIFPEWLFGKNSALLIYVDHFTHVVIDTGRTGLRPVRDAMKNGDIGKWGAMWAVLRAYARNSPAMLKSMAEAWRYTGTFPVQIGWSSKVGMGGGVAGVAAIVLLANQVIDEEMELIRLNDENGMNERERASRNNLIEVQTGIGRKLARDYIATTQYTCKCPCSDAKFDQTAIDALLEKGVGACMSKRVVIGPSFDVEGCARRLSIARKSQLEALCKENGKDCRLELKK